MFNTKAQKELKAEYLPLFKERDRKYYSKQTEVIVKLSTGEYVPLERLNIQTSFYYGEGIHRSMEDALDLCKQAENDEKHFINSNLEQIDSKIRKILSYLHIVNAGVYSYPRYYSTYADARVANFIGCNEWDDIREDARKLTDVDAALIVKGLWYQRRLFQKRLRTYLKRYGLSKVTADTYWMDR